MNEQRIATGAFDSRAGNARQALLLGVHVGADTTAENELGRFTIDYDTAVALAAAIVAQRGTGTGTSGFTPFRTWNEFEDFIDNLPAGTFTVNGGTYQRTYTMTGIGTNVDGSKAPVGGFYETLILDGVGHKDMVKAICNPNTVLRRFGHMPNQSGYLAAVPRLALPGAGGGAGHGG